MGFWQTRSEEIARYDGSNLNTETTGYVEKAIPSRQHWGSPESCPLNNKLHIWQAPQASIFCSTSYGGPGSKYKTINEDSFFYGMDPEGKLISGVIDGAGGSMSGYLGGKLANESLSYGLSQGLKMKDAFRQADDYVTIHGKGGYATGLAITIREDRKVFLGSKGDTKALTIRNGRIIKDGTTKIQSHVAIKIEYGELPPHAIHTGEGKNLIYSMIGNAELPLFETRFQGRRGDTIIIGSDGLWDVVSDYEVQQLALHNSGVNLQKKLFNLAFQRNNSKQPFFIHFKEDEVHLMHAMHAVGKRSRGDNITIQVIELA